jgi:hypothetical protein
MPLAKMELEAYMEAEKDPNFKKVVYKKIMEIY